LESILTQHCKNFVLVSLREMGQGKSIEYAYHVKLKKGKSDSGLVDNLKSIDTIRSINLMLQETTVEL